MGKRKEAGRRSGLPLSFLSLLALSSPASLRTQRSFNGRKIRFHFAG